MNKLELTFPEVVFLGITHLVLGAGLALLVSERLDSAARKGFGGVLLAAGIVSALPRIAIILRGREREESGTESPQGTRRAEHHSGRSELRRASAL